MIFQGGRPVFTAAEDKALIVKLAGLPTARLLAIIAFMLLRQLADRDQLVTRLQQ